MADGNPRPDDTAAPEKPTSNSSAPSTDAETKRPADDVEFLLKQAEEALRSANNDEPSAQASYELPELNAAPPSTEHASLELLRDVELDLRIELGRTRMHLQDVLQLGKGAVVALDKLAGDPVDVYVNGRLVARGEILVLNDNFCIRVTELVSGHEFGAA